MNDPHRVLAEIQRLRKQIVESEGGQVYRELLAVQGSRELFTDNYTELKQALDAFRDPGMALPLWDVGNRGQFDEYLGRVDRLLQNFLASAASLADHTRRVAEKLYTGSSFWAEYSTRKDRDFAHSPLSRFVRDLRSYTLHRQIPLTHGRLNVSPGLSFDSSIVLVVSELRAWDRWTAPARAYLDAQGDGLRLDDFVEPYKDTVVAFHQWLASRQDALHRAPLDELHRLQQELHRLIPASNDT